MDTHTLPHQRFTGQLDQRATPEGDILTIGPGQVVIGDEVIATTAIPTEIDLGTVPEDVNQVLNWDPVNDRFTVGARLSRTYEDVADNGYSVAVIERTGRKPKRPSIIRQKADEAAGRGKDSANDGTVAVTEVVLLALLRIEAMAARTLAVVNAHRDDLDLNEAEAEILNDTHSAISAEVLSGSGVNFHNLRRQARWGDKPASRAPGENAEVDELRKTEILPPLPSEDPGNFAPARRPTEA